MAGKTTAGTRTLSDDEKFLFYAAVRRSVREHVKKGEKFKQNDFFGRFLRDYPECSKEALGICSYSQIFPSLSEFIVFKGEGLNASMEFIPLQRYEDQIRRSGYGLPPAGEDDFFVYARIFRICREGVFYSSGADGGTLLSSPSPADADFLDGHKEGDWIWGVCRKHGNIRYLIPCRKEDSGFVDELRAFFRHYKEGESVYLPVTGFLNNMFYVNIGPNAYVTIPSSSVSHPLRDRIRPGMVFFMRISGLAEGPRGRLKVFLVFEKEAGDGNAPSSRTGVHLEKTASDDIGYLPVSENTIMHISEDQRIYAALENHLSSPPDRENVRSLVLEKYRKYYGTGMSIAKKKGGSVMISIPLDICDSGGVPLDAYVNRNAGRDSFFLAAISSATPEDQMKRLLSAPNWDGDIEELSLMALGEDWTWKFERKNHILYNYILCCFYKSCVDGGIVHENGYAVFNTGLMDREYNDIYGCMKETGHSGRKMSPVWKFMFFASRGNKKNGKRLNLLFSRFPAPPVYITPDRCCDLFFDPYKDLSVDFYHILSDNLDRFPADFVCSCLRDDAVRERVLREGPDAVLRAAADSADGIHFLCASLAQCVRRSVREARRSYRLAVPVYYPRTNGISLLIPLWLTPKDVETGKASAALVVERLPNGNYQGQTVFTPSMCIADARQIGKVDITWL